MAQAQPQRQQGNRNLDSYVGVHTRVELFREAHPTARLVTNILERESLTVRAEIYLDGNESTIPNAVGHASVDGGMGNREGSAVEKTESAAVGRALAFLGYEIKAGIASREEMQRVERQPAPVRIDPASVPGVSKGMPPKKDAKETRDADIMTALEVLGKSEDWLNVQMGKKWPNFGGIDWTDLGQEYKHELWLGLNKMVNEKSNDKAAAK